MTKPSARKGTKPAKKLTVAQRRAILVKAKWSLVAGCNDDYSPDGRNAASSPCVNVAPLQICEGPGCGWDRATDAEFRAFVKRHTPKGKAVMHNGVTDAKYREQYEGALDEPTAPKGKPAVAKAATTKGVTTKGVSITVEGHPVIYHMPVGIADVFKHALGRIDALEAAGKATDANWNDAVRSARQYTASVADRVSCIEASTERSVVMADQPVSVGGHWPTHGNSPFINVTSGVPVAVPMEPPPVDVAALCRRHGLTLGEFDEWRSTPGGRLPQHHPAAKPYMRVIRDGRWEWNDPSRRAWTQDKGDPATLAAALAKYCPVKGAANWIPVPPPAPYGEPERRADAIAAGWVEDENGVFYPTAIGLGDQYGTATASIRGKIRDPNGPWRDADRDTFRAHLAKYAVKAEPFDDAWRIAECERLLWVRHPEWPNIWLPCPGANHLHRAVSISHALFTIDGDATYTCPSRAEWTRFLEKYAVKPDPDATPEQRRAELERRGLKARWAEGCYGKPGTISGYPCAWDTGTVYRSDPDFTATRTLAEFRAALDAVGLVKAPLAGDGPFTVEQLNAAGVECYESDFNVWFRLPNAMVTRHGDVGYHGVSQLDRRRLLHAANDPDVNPEWAARVRKALGEASND